MRDSYHRLARCCAAFDSVLVLACSVAVNMGAEPASMPAAPAAGVTAGVPAGYDSDVTLSLVYYLEVDKSGGLDRLNGGQHALGNTLWQIAGLCTCWQRT